MNRVKWYLISIAIIASTLLATGCMSFEKTSIDLVTKPFTYIADFPGKTEDEIYRNCKLWIANTYNSAKSVISYEDADLKQIRGNGIGSAKLEGDPFIRKFSYSISIEIKGAKARLLLSNIQEERYFNGTTSVAGIPNLEYKIYYDAVKKYFDEIGINFQKNVFASSTSW